MKTLTLLYFILLPAIIKGQNVDLSQVNTAGAHHESAQVKLSWSIGQAVAESFGSGALSVSSGVHQPQAIITSLRDQKKYQISVFPNPTFDLLTISSYGSDEPYSINDLNGGMILQGQMKTSITHIDMSSLVAGVYFLCIGEVQMFKIIKR